MKIKMLEHFQGSNLPTLAEGEEYDNLEKDLVDWLLEHRKCVVVKEPAPKPEPKQEPVKEPEPKKVEVKAEKKPAPERARKPRGSAKK